MGDEVTLGGRECRRSGDDDEGKLIIVLSCLSAFLGLLVILLLIKLFYYRCHSQATVIEDGDTSVVVQNGDISNKKQVEETVIIPTVEQDSNTSPVFNGYDVGILEPPPLKAPGFYGPENSVSEIEMVSALEQYFSGVAAEGEINPAYEETDPDAASLLLDTDLKEMLEPDMKESKLLEIRSKLVVFMSRRIDHTGGQLVLDKMGISLYIPPCALEKPEIIFLALNWDLGDFPRLEISQSIISPVVHVGPHGMKLKRPATLSFRHCAFDPKEVKVYASETHLMEHKVWRETDHGDSDVKTHTILDTECQVYISHFTLYTCITEGSKLKKWLQLVAFGGEMRVGGHYEIRVYVVNNTPCALQFAIESERRHGFKLLKCPQEYLFNGDESDMNLQVESVSEGWSMSINDRQETIPFVYIWHGKCPYASFVFKHENKTAKDISVKLCAFQDKNQHKLTLRLLEKMPAEQNISSPESSPVVPHKLKMVLVPLLEPTCPLGKDWRIIASELNVDGLIPYMKGRDSPLEEVLREMERKQKDLTWLMKVLLIHNRLDAASIISNYLNTGKIIDN